MLHKKAYVTVMLIALISCSNEEDNGADSIDDDTVVDTVYDITPILSKFVGTGVSYAISGENVIFTTEDVPNHTSPYWPEDNALHSDYTGSNPDWNQNPNEIVAQNIVLTIPLHPEEATIHEATPLGPIGISRNGVVFLINMPNPIYH